MSVTTKGKLGRGYLLLGAASLLAFTVVTGCDVEQTEEGNMPDVDVDAESGELPDYDVVQREEGEMPDVDVDVEGGDLPEYDVEGPDVDVGTRQKTVEVPKVKIVREEEEISVPYVDVDWPDETRERVDQQVTVQVEAPNDSFNLAIEEIYIVEDELWVVSRLHGDPGAGSSGAIASDTVVVKAPEMEVKHFVIGPEATPVDDEAEYEFLASRSELDDDVREGRQIYTG